MYTGAVAAAADGSAVVGGCSRVDVAFGQQKEKDRYDGGQAWPWIVH